MKTKIIRKILAAMVAAATIASTAGVASAGFIKPIDQETISNYLQVGNGEEVWNGAADNLNLENGMDWMHELEGEGDDLEYELEEEDCEWLNMTLEVDAALENGEFDSVANRFYRMAEDLSNHTNSNVAYMLSVLNKCSRGDGQTAKTDIAKSIGCFVFDVNIHGSLKDMMGIILEILGRCVNDDAAKVHVLSALEKLAKSNLLDGDEKKETALNILNACNIQDEVANQIRNILVH